MGNAISQAFLLQQRQAKQELGPLYDEIKEICPRAGWFAVDRENGQLAFVPSSGFAISGETVIRLIAATAGEMTIKSLCIRPDDKGLLPYLVFSGLHFPSIQYSFLEQSSDCSFLW